MRTPSSVKMFKTAFLIIIHRSTLVLCKIAIRMAPQDLINYPILNSCISIVICFPKVQLEDSKRHRICRGCVVMLASAAKQQRPRLWKQRRPSGLANIEVLPQVCPWDETIKMRTPCKVLHSITQRRPRHLIKKLSEIINGSRTFNRKNNL